MDSKEGCHIFGLLANLEGLSELPLGVLKEVKNLHFLKATWYYSKVPWHRGKIYPFCPKKGGQVALLEYDTEKLCFWLKVSSLMVSSAILYPIRAHHKLLSISELTVLDAT